MEKNKGRGRRNQRNRKTEEGEIRDNKKAENGACRGREGAVRMEGGEEEGSEEKRQTKRKAGNGAGRGRRMYRKKGTERKGKVDRKRRKRKK